MHVMFRPPQLIGALLLVAAPFAQAESPMPDPIAPAVVGRPLDQIRPARAAGQKPVAAKPKARKQVTAGNKAIRDRRAQTASVRVAPPAAPVAQQTAVQPAPVPQHVATQAPNPAAAARTQVAENMGRSTRVAGQPIGPGAYFSTRDQALVRGYYDAHPVSGQLATWKVGEPIPPKAALTGVPDDLRAALTALPAGHQYVQVDGDVVLVAVQSRVVVDGISRSLRQAPSAASLSLGAVPPRGLVINALPRAAARNRDTVAASR